MIDNEESFVEAAGTDAERGETPKPWDDGGVTNDVGDFDEHPLWRGIKQHKDAPFGDIVKQWRSLSEAKVQGYANDPVFGYWSRSVAHNIADYLLEAIENIDAIYMQIEENKCR